MKKIRLGVSVRTAIDAKKDGAKRLYVAKEFVDILSSLGVTLVPFFTINDLDDLEGLCDGLLVPGSYANIDPKYYGGEKKADVEYGEDEFSLDKLVIERFHNNHKAILGVCAGIQEINVYFGGTLKQDVVDHCNDGTHEIIIDNDSVLFDIYKEERKEVNTLHYQGLDKVAEGFKVTAKALDGTIEAIEKDNILAVQWHPELMNDVKIFEYFVNNIVK